MCVLITCDTGCDTLWMLCECQGIDWSQEIETFELLCLEKRRKMAIN